MSPKSYVVSLVLIFSVGILVNPQNFNTPVTYAQNVNTVRVPATAGDSSHFSTWVDSGLELAGNTVSVSSSGLGYYCPACTSTPDGPPQGSPDAGKPPGLCPSCNLARVPVGALIAKVGDGNPVFVGSGPTTLGGNGRIYFSFNDGYGDHSNNSGEYSVTVRGLPAGFLGEVRETTKIAIIFTEVHIYQSHASIGCGNWQLYGSISTPGNRYIQQKILDKCVNQDNTYPLEYEPSIVVDSFDPKILKTVGNPGDWDTCGDFCSHGTLGQIEPLTIDKPPVLASSYIEDSKIVKNMGFLNREVEFSDYRLSFIIQNCRTGFSDNPGSPCGQRPGIYYHMPGSPIWIAGEAPNFDLEGCSWFGCG